LAITNGGVVTDGIGALSLNSGSQADVTIGGAGSIWSNTGALYIGGNGNYAGGTGVLTVQTGGTVNAGATLEIWSGSTLNLNGGTIQAAGFIVPAGTFNFNYGTVRCTSDLTIDLSSTILGSSFGITTAKQLQVDGTTTLGVVLTLDGGAFSTGSLVNPQLLRLNSGTFNLTGDNLTIGPGGLFGGTLAVPANKTYGVTHNATVQTGGLLDMRGGAFAAGSLANLGTIQGTGQIDAPLDNLSAGIVRGFAGDHLAFGGGGHVNQGQLQLYGGTIEFAGDLTNAAGGTILGGGALIASGGLTNNGNIAFSSNTFVNGGVTNSAAGKIIAAGGTTTFFGNVVNNGEIHSGNGSYAVFFGNVTGGGSLTGPGIFDFEGNLLAANVALPQGIVQSNGPASTAASITGGGDLVVGGGLMPAALTVGDINLHTVTVVRGSTLTAASITADTLTIGAAPVSVAVPEPSTIALIGMGTLGLLILGCRRQFNKNRASKSSLR
jgi:T5SS/PEP-CTERM-associated repeat protein